MNSVIEDIKTRLVHGESVDFISLHTGVPKDWIKKAFNLK